MHADRCDHFIAFCINYADAVRLGVDDVEFIFLAVGRNSSGFAAHANRLRRLKSTQINYGNSVAFSVGDVGILAISGAVAGELAFVEIPPPERSHHRECDNEEKEFFQADGLTEDATSGRTAGGVGACVPIAGTVLPTTGAICRTCFISSSNCSG